MSLSKSEMIAAVQAGMDKSLGFTGNESAAERRAVLGGSGSGSSSSSDVNVGDDDDAKPDSEKFSASAFIDRLAKNLGTTADALPSAVKGAISTIGEMIDEQNKGIKAVVTNELEYLMTARKVLGNISTDMSDGHLKIAGDAKHYVDTFESILIDGTNSMQASSELVFKEGYGSNLDPMYNFFVSAAAAAGKFAAIMSEVSEDTPKIIQEITDIEAKKITFFSETLQIAERDVGTLLKRQYAFTGEASDKILGDIGTTSKALSDTTGIAANQLKTGILDVMKDVDKFGDIGVDSAGRISAALLQLGVSFNSFQRMTDQFMNFDSAASKMGELSTLFGVQMDAMEMTYLANEDQEEFLFRMREEILDSGIDVENMSKTRARALASQLNMNVMEMKTFLRGEELSFDQEALEGSTAMADNMDALTVAGRDFGNEFARSAQSAAEALDEKFVPGIVKSRDEILKLTSQSNKSYAAIQQFEIPDSFNKLQTELVGAQVALEQVKTVTFDTTVDGINAVVRTGSDLLYDFYSENIDQYKDKIVSEIDDLYKKYEPDQDGNVNRKILSQLEVEVTGINTTDIQKVVDVSTINTANSQAQVTELIDAFAVSTAQADQLIAKLENEEPIIFKVDLDGDTIADTTYKVLLKNGQIITADTKA